MFSISQAAFSGVLKLLPACGSAATITLWRPARSANSMKPSRTRDLPVSQSGFGSPTVVVTMDGPSPRLRSFASSNVASARRNMAARSSPAAHTSRASMIGGVGNPTSCNFAESSFLSSGPKLPATVCQPSLAQISIASYPIERIRGRASTISTSFMP